MLKCWIFSQTRQGPFLKWNAMKEKRKTVFFSKEKCYSGELCEELPQNFCPVLGKNDLLIQDLIEIKITHCSFCYSATNHRVYNQLPVTCTCMSRLETVMWCDAFSGVLVCFELMSDMVLNCSCGCSFRLCQLNVTAIITSVVTLRNPKTKIKIPLIFKWLAFTNHLSYPKNEKLA